MIMNIKNSGQDYSVFIYNNSLEHLSSYISEIKPAKTLLITDSGVPQEYIDTVKNQIKITDSVILKQGETNKNLNSVQLILEKLCLNNFCRTDRILALGGGVVGDLSGFTASIYMRGIDWFNIPTTLLSQVDSSIGGKTGFDFMNHKNLIGSFYPPSSVVIDPILTKTQSKREFYSGMVEALKMAICFDINLYGKIIEFTDYSQLEQIIADSLLIKKSIVEMDEKEKGCRKLLNFGHTLGHAIELSQNNNLNHGECVAIGMLAFSSENIKKELISLYKKWEIPYKQPILINSVVDNILFDKKANSNGIETVFLSEIEKTFTKTLSITELKQLILDFDKLRLSL